MSEEITRSITDITEEIQELKTEAQCLIVHYVCKIGKKLSEAKAILQHGEWAEWLENEVNFSQRTATNYMKIYEEYGSEQMSLFSGNSQAIANLGYTKALQLLAIPAAEREDFVEENKVEELSTRQLDDLIRDRDEALKKAREAEAIQEQLEIATAKVRKSETDAAIAGKKLTEALDEKAKIEDQLAKEKERIKKLEENPIIPDKLKEKLKADAEFAVKTEYEEQSRELDERIAKVEAKIKQSEADKAVAEAKVAELEKRLSMSSTEVTEFKTAFEQVQTWNNRCRDILGRIDNPETASKLKAAMKAFLNKALTDFEEDNNE